MISKEKVFSWIEDLEQKGKTVADAYGYSVNARIVNGTDKIYLSTPIYSGGNFIPQSVRECMDEKVPQPPECQMETYLSLDEEKYQIQLNYLGLANFSNVAEFKNLVECFCHIAEEWRFKIDENDKRDLLPIPQN